MLQRPATPGPHLPLEPRWDLHRDPSRRDDVYGVGLVLAELVIRLQAMVDGTTREFERDKMPTYLPWALEASDEAIGAAKQTQLTDFQSDFYQSMPSQAAQILYAFLEQAHDLKFKQTPDYQAFKDLVANLQIPCAAKKSASKTKAKKKRATTRSSSKTTKTTAAAAKSPAKKCKPVPYTVDSASSSSKPAAATKLSSGKNLKTVPYKAPTFADATGAFEAANVHASTSPSHHRRQERVASVVKFMVKKQPTLTPAEKQQHYPDKQKRLAQEAAAKLEQERQ